MGKILRISKLTTMFEAIIAVVALVLVLGGIYWFAPGLRVSDSKSLKALELSADNINNITKGTMLSLPSADVSTDVAKLPLVRIAEYAWNCNSGMIASNGGPRTTKGSLMEVSKVNLEIVRQDMVGGLRDMQINFVKELDGGVEYPISDKSAFAVSIMGDGVPAYV
jgi:hypothetical protein